MKYISVAKIQCTTLISHSNNEYIYNLNKEANYNSQSPKVISVTKRDIYNMCEYFSFRYFIVKLSVYHIKMMVYLSDIKDPFP